MKQMLLDSVGLVFVLLASMCVSLYAFRETWGWMGVGLYCALFVSGVVVRRAIAHKARRLVVDRALAATEDPDDGPELCENCGAERRECEACSYA